MKTEKIITLLLVSMIIFTMAGYSACGCITGAKYGYSQSKALNRYLLVNEATENFGFKRMKLNIGYNNNLKGFIETHGLPDFIYEYKNDKGRDSIKMFYVEKDIVYVYESQSWVANTQYLKETRPLTEYEKNTYEQLKKEELKKKGQISL